MSKQQEIADIEKGPERPAITQNLLGQLSNAKVIYLPAFGGDFQPGLYKPSLRKFGNPAPLGLCGFALTTFVSV